MSGLSRAGQGQNFLIIVGTYWILVIRLIAGLCLTAGALEQQDNAFFRVELISDGLKLTVTGVCPVAREVIDMLAGKAPRTVISAS